MVTTVARVCSSIRLVLIARLHLLRTTIRTLLTIGVILCLRTLLWRVTSLPIRRGVRIHAMINVSMENE